MSILSENNRLNLLSSAMIYLVAPDKVEIVEYSKSGAGTLTFAHDSVSLIALPSGTQQPLAWYGESKCADGAVITFKDQLEVHLVELKSGINVGKWVDVKRQFHGMLANVLSLLGFLGLPSPTKIVCHLAFHSQSIFQQIAANPALRKGLLGAPRPASPSAGAAAYEFNQGYISLMDIAAIEVRMYQRDSSGNAIGNLR